MMPAASEAVPFAAYRDFVRWQLRRCGAASDALDDLVQEVWVVSLARSPRLVDDASTRAWLSQVCRRVVASDRRSRARTPLLREPVPEIRVAPEQGERMDEELGERHRRAAFARLSDAQIDLLSLYGGGELTMREVAELIGAPEQTVYSQYRAAVERAAKELRRFQRREPDEPDVSQLAPSALAHESARREGDEAKADAGKFISYRNDHGASLGRVGNVVLCQWRERTFVQTTDQLGALLRQAHARMQTSVVVVNDVHPEVKLPNAEERKALREHIRTHSALAVLAVDVITTAPLRHMISAVIKGMMLFTRSPTSLIIVGTVEAACHAIAPHARMVHGGISAPDLERAFARLRTPPVDFSDRARSTNQ